MVKPGRRSTSGLYSGKVSVTLSQGLGWHCDGYVMMQAVAIKDAEACGWPRLGPTLRAPEFNGTILHYGQEPSSMLLGKN
jgi:hypothetical protein